MHRASREPRVVSVRSYPSQTAAAWQSSCGGRWDAPPGRPSRRVVAPPTRDRAQVVDHDDKKGDLLAAVAGVHERINQQAVTLCAIDKVTGPAA